MMAPVSQLHRALLVTTFLMLVICVAMLSLPSLHEYTIRLPAIQHLSASVKSSLQQPLRASGPKFVPAVPEPNRQYRKGLIVSAISRDNMSWVHETLPEVDAYIYINDDPDAEYSVPMNKGNEVMPYLTFLIDHYDNLPEIMIFIHGHARTFHNPYLFRQTSDMVKLLNPARVVREGYMNLHCGDWDAKSCPAQIRPADSKTWWQFNKGWREIFPEYEVPEILAQYCCSQFAISRERALQVPRATLQRYRQWMLDTELPSKISGYVWEYLWQFVFTGQHVYCPAQHECYCDGYGFCFGGEKAYAHFNSLYVSQLHLQEEIDAINRAEDAAEDMDDAARREEIVETGRVRRDKMEKVVLDLRAEMRRISDAAQIRGQDPRIRAEESRRPWKVGDGF